MTATDYDEFAAAYTVENESNLFNAYYERPAMLRLAGDVAGRRILDAGCGSGPLAAELRERGAAVSGFDASAAMVDLARQRLGEDADLRVADLAAPLPYADGEFDDVVVAGGGGWPHVRHDILAHRILDILREKPAYPAGRFRRIGLLRASKGRGADAALAHVLVLDDPAYRRQDLVHCLILCLTGFGHALPTRDSAIRTRLAEEAGSRNRAIRRGPCDQPARTRLSGRRACAARTTCP